MRRLAVLLTLALFLAPGALASERAEAAMTDLVIECKPPAKASASLGQGSLSAKATSCTSSFAERLRRAERVGVEMRWNATTGRTVNLTLLVSTGVCDYGTCEWTNVRRVTGTSPLVVDVDPRLRANRLEVAVDLACPTRACADASLRQPVTVGVSVR